ncbi:hypothetical protein GC089_17890 [Cellulomonas sp. JZ18]|uniref:hypothetical protein n=1 Tax=Cellulomonas sp. JZ18 TaxID=2654191 RepID=UPI0012D3894A|nr:hypothetical protein [Cellulomonas sp. JZ18]QGQ20715.1 hypothetical protein GC089_17890 [Cellulomonas sp. JZ18]
MAGAVLAVLLAACADTPDAGSGALETSAPATPTATSGATPDSTGDATPSPTPTVPSAAETFFPGAPEGVGGEEVEVLADEDPRRIRVVTWGSSTCPTLPDQVVWDEAAQVLRVTLTDATAYGDRACTADIAPTTSVVALPEGSPDATSLTVEVAGERLTLG